jgi:hypothetical protein
MVNAPATLKIRHLMFAVGVAALASFAGVKQVEHSVFFRKISVGLAAELFEGTIAFTLVVAGAIIVYELALRRFTWPALTSQPGFTACAVSFVGVLSVFAWGLPLHVAFCFQTGKWDYFFSLYYEDFFRSRSDTHPLLCNGAACAVAAAWLMQLIGGRWNAVPTWTDRIGRLVGAYWLTRHVIEFLVWNLR